MFVSEQPHQTNVCECMIISSSNLLISRGSPLNHVHVDATTKNKHWV